MDISQEIKQSFKSGSMLTKLIYINIAVFLFVNLCYLIDFLFKVEIFSNIVIWLAVPAKLSELLFKPWSPVTYMFLHEDFWHILGNLLWLFFLGRVFLMFLQEKQLLSVYLLGGLAGAALYILTFNIFPVFRDVLDRSIALGASASVTAVIIAIAVYKPNFSLYFFGLFRIQLKYIAIFYVVYDFVSILQGNAGGHIAHLGGAIYGYFFIRYYSEGKNIAKGFDRFMDKLFTYFKPGSKSKRNIKVTYRQQNPPVSDYEYNARKQSEQERVDRILEKIKKSGYDSLTKEEKEFLFRVSNR